ncbi:MAG TPA: hypothetical protein VLM40_13825 [Gemmata sp.]|nr:hypothetical protein [Gemmata sp.]
MHYLVIDSRFGTPIYVFLEIDPRTVDAYPGLAVREVAIELASAEHCGRRRFTIGRDPHHLDLFREFGSDGAAAGAGFILIEPRYVGPTWEAYSREYRPQGEKPPKSPRRWGIRAER